DVPRCRARGTRGAAAGQSHVLSCRASAGSAPPSAPLIHPLGNVRLLRFHAGADTFMRFMRRVVITGIGVVSPLGIGTAAFWKNLLAGQVALGPITAFDPAGFPCHIGGEVPDYKIGDFVPKSYRKATKVMARDIE